ncbi:MAG: SIR2 family protein [Candidatus Nealsonbacteria bacterium]|nr:SIR2 family protein [Candidatus Nealsonbacteria bacterium]
MSDPEIPKIVYLFGAGATHAEKLLECKIKGTGFNELGELERGGLLASDISKRVIDKLFHDKPEIANDYGITKLSIDDPRLIENADIELLISLVETLKTDKSENDVKFLKDFFKKEISENLLVDGNNIIPRLYSSLLELHGLIGHEEQLIGFLTLNYDSLFEKSFELINKIRFNYGLAIGNPPISCKPEDSYLLKLHGSFDWYLDLDNNKIIISTKQSEEPLWIPPRLNKEYLDYPYNLIHGKAYELLGQCDILRVVGCSLNQNDIRLISLLFKTQRLKRLKPYLIEIISPPEACLDIIKRLGLILSFDESFYDKGWNKFGIDADNSFLDWLYYRAMNIREKISLEETIYLKDVEKWINL